MRELLEKLYLFLPTVIVCFLLGRFLLPPEGRLLRVIMICLFSIALTLLTIFTFTRPSWRWGDIANFASETAHDKPDTAAYAFAWNNFILVDNFRDKQLIPDTENDSSYHLNEIITDRKKIASLLGILQNHINDVDLIVCDIGFETPSPDDSLLAARIHSIAGSGKLILSVNQGIHTNPAFQFNDSLYGNIREQTNDKLFVSHYIVSDRNNSLPFTIYSKLHGATTGSGWFGQALLHEKTGDKGQAWIANPFLPEFRIMDEQLLWEGDEDSSSTLHKFFVGQIVAASGSADFIQNLERRKRFHKKNIVLLGSFGSDGEDVHQTLYRQLHGPVILLNIIYALERGQHRITWGFVIILLIGYSLISWFLLYSALGLQFINGEERERSRLSLPLSTKAYNIVYNAAQLIYEAIASFFEFLLKEEPQFILLFVLVWFVHKATHRMINALSLLLYLGIVYICLKAVREKIKK